MLSLIPFHRGLITAGIVFCFGYAAWEIAAFNRSGNLRSGLIAALFVLLGLGLVFYLSRLNRFLGYESRDREER